MVTYSEKKFLEKFKKFDYLCIMNKSYVFVGQQYGKLTVISFSHRKKYESGSVKKFWKCSCECGGEVITDSSGLTGSRTKSCGCNRNKGGKINKDGYRLVYDREDRIYKLQHRYVYEKEYNIKLKPHHNIHHINGDRLDNRIVNLELWDTSQPKGQRVEDKIIFYKKLIEDYKDNPLYKHLFT
jgi:hypothetical protein